MPLVELTTMASKPLEKSRRFSAENPFAGLKELIEEPRTEGKRERFRTSSISACTLRELVTIIPPLSREYLPIAAKSRTFLNLNEFFATNGADFSSA